MNIAEIRQAHQSNKQKSQEDNDAYQAKYYARPVSYYLAWLLIKMGFTPNAVSVLAFVIGIAGCIGIATGDYAKIIAGVILMNIRHLLDYADGTVARATNKTTKFGTYLDRLLDEFIGVILPISIGLSLFNNPITKEPGLFLLMGLVYSIVTATSALALAQVGLVYGIMPHTFYQTSKRGLWRMIYSAGTNLQSTSVILLIPFSIMNRLDLYLVCYLLLTFSELIAAVTIRMIRHEDN
jgi:phosphatidylglycerophosphate synthase